MVYTWHNKFKIQYTKCTLTVVLHSQPIPFPLYERGMVWYICLVLRATGSRCEARVTEKMSHQYCWLCEIDLSKGSMKAKRKKLDGDATTKSTVKLLESISLDYLGKG